MRWVLSEKSEKRFRSGHPWVFSNELTHSPKGIEPGQIVELVSSTGQFLAWGTGNPNSLIAFRCLSRNANDDVTTPDWIAHRLLKAARFRHKQRLLNHSHRLCFSEADGLSGLIIDVFKVPSGRQFFSVQVLSAGMENLTRNLLSILRSYVEAARVDGLPVADWDFTGVIVHKNSRARTLEGLTVEDSQVAKSVEGVDPILCDIELASTSSLRKDPLLMSTRLVGGQKTGFFLDQSLNISLLLKHLPQFATGSTVRVLDLFCYVGQWSSQIANHLHEKHKVEVLLVDSSESALEIASHNVKRNGGSAEALKLDIVEAGKQLPERAFDIVICDPPALIKSKKDLHAGLRAYQKVNQFALHSLAQDGFFVSCSCSQHLSEEDLVSAIQLAQRRQNRRLVELIRGGQSPDHPVLLTFPQGKYLKAWLGMEKS